MPLTGGLVGKWDKGHMKRLVWEWASVPDASEEQLCDGNGARSPIPVMGSLPLWWDYLIQEMRGIETTAL